MILLRSALFNGWFFGVTFVMVFPGAAIRLLAPSYTLAFAMLWARVVLAGLEPICGIRVAVTGREHLPNQGAALIASRHQSTFDTLVWLTLVPRCCYVAKLELMRIPLFGGMLKDSGTILIDRSLGAQTMRDLMAGGERAAGEERQIVIFPEGTRADPGAPLALQPGIAALAARTRLGVIPVATDSGNHWGRRAFRKLPGTIHIVIRPPIPAGTPRRELMRLLAERLELESLSVDNSVD